jgi:hypothetical protein
MSAVTSYSPYYANSDAGCAGSSPGHEPGAGASSRVAGAPFANSQHYFDPSALGTRDYWNPYPPSSNGAYQPSTRLMPPPPDARDYWNANPRYPQSPGYPPPSSRPVLDFNGWLQTRAPKSWDRGRNARPGDQVIYHGNVYQAPNQGGLHRGVPPTSDASKWLYHGTVVNNYNYYLKTRSGRT